MFELLLQADRALAEGELERAERTYWQLIELDPSNAIALAGLARFSLERGDKRLARTLANRALGIDPQSVLAQRVVDALERHETATQSGDAMDLTAAAQQLENLGRRRRQAIESDTGTAEAAAATSTDDATPAESEFAWAVQTQAAPRGRRSIRAAIEAEAATVPADGTERTAEARTSPRETETSRPTRRLSTEESRERRQRGRIAAAAAAAGAAARERATPAPKPATSSDDGTAKAEPRKRAPVDPFAAAEMAAAIEAVDEVDEELPAEAEVAEAEVAAEADVVAEGAAEADVVAEGAAEGAAEAAAEAETEAAPNDASEGDDGAQARRAEVEAQLRASAAEAEAAEAEAESARMLTLEREAMAAAADMDLDEYDEAAQPAPEEAPLATGSETAEVEEPPILRAETPEAAEPEAAKPQAVEPEEAAGETTLEPRKPSGFALQPGQSEEEAEAAALREALAIVLGGEAEPQVEAAKDSTEPAAGTSETAGTAASAEPARASGPVETGSVEPQAGEGERQGGSGDSAGAANPEPPVDTEARRRKGILGRFRGN